MCWLKEGGGGRQNKWGEASKKQARICTRLTQMEVSVSWSEAPLANGGGIAGFIPWLQGRSRQPPGDGDAVSAAHDIRIGATVRGGLRIDAPAPLAIALGGAMGAVIRTVLSAMLPRFAAMLAEDFKRWSGKEDRTRAAGSFSQAAAAPTAAGSFVEVEAAEGLASKDASAGGVEIAGESKGASDGQR